MLAVSCSLFQITSAVYLLLLGIYKRRRKYRQTALLSSLGRKAKRRMRQYRRMLRPGRSNIWWENFLNNKVVNEEWKENFRMSKSNFMKLCNQLRPYIEKKTTRFRKPLSVETQVAIMLYYIADEGRMQKVAAFGIAKCTISVVVRFVTKIISNIMGSSIKLPETEEEVKVLVTEFYRQHGFPQCFGAVAALTFPLKDPRKMLPILLTEKGDTQLIAKHWWIINTVL